MTVPFSQTIQRPMRPKCRLPDKPRPQPQARGSLQLPRHTHTVPEHGKGEMPKRGNPSWVLFGSFSQRERTINSFSLPLQSNRQSPHLQHQRSSAELPPLRRRPKGFPVALWKPSVPSDWRERTINKCNLFHQSSGSRPAISMNAAAAQRFRLCGGAKGLSGRPLETFGSLRLESRNRQHHQPVPVFCKGKTNSRADCSALRVRIQFSSQSLALGKV